MTLTLLGHVPSKKNLWKPRKGGGIRLDATAKTDIDRLTLQARASGIKGLEHPGMSVTFYVQDRRADRDNKLSCILDVLQTAGVLVNDNVAHFNGLVMIKPAVVASGQERTIISFSTEAASVGVAYADEGQ